MEPRVIFEDSDILALDKPAGMIVNHSDTTAGEKTVQEWVENKFKIHPPASEFAHRRSRAGSSKFKVDEESDFCNRAGIVHRLDKETSGILLVAKSPEAFENLQKQFKERKVKKTYIAFVHGKVEPREGEINVPVGRLPWNRKRFGVVLGGREAVTKYKVLSIKYKVSEKQEREPFSLLKLYPETGRTHQIRVHLKYFNHPIFSDPLYAGRKTARNDRKLLPRIFLHASKISFCHPKTGKLIYFESELPNQLSFLLSSFSIDE